MLSFKSWLVKLTSLSEWCFHKSIIIRMHLGAAAKLFIRATKVVVVLIVLLVSILSLIMFLTYSHVVEVFSYRVKPRY